MNEGVAQRRNLAILFSDLCDSTGISAGLEPEQYAALLGELRGLYDAVVERHGGLIVRIDGDGLLCAFGYPDAQEDAGRRAAEAALDLHRATAALDLGGVPARLHSGIHSGVVLVREGDMVRGRIEILGDATNIAARLCDAADAGQILISEASLGGDRHFFKVAGDVQVPVRGRDAPVRALLVTGREEVGTRFDARMRRGTAPFCGREAELARLRAMLAELRGGASRQVLLWGPPGIGKTRLLAEFLAEVEAAGLAVCRGYCEAYLGARPLQPFEQIAAALGRPGSTQDVLLDWARQQDASPAVLAIDDWQWADDASAALLEEVARLRGQGLLVLLASRPEGAAALPGERIERIELGPLSAGESDQAIAALLRGADPFRVERIRELAGGSPLFIEELCHAQSARLPGDEPAESSDGSAWLDTLVASRFRELPAPHAELVRVASVIGHMVPLDLFAAVTGVGEDDPVLAELSASDFLHRAEVGRALRFKHALTRDAIYRTVGLAERKRLHALVASQIEALSARDGEDDHVDALAYHHAACGQFGQAIGFAVRAGDRALAAGALDRAQAHYRASLNMLDKVPDWRADDERVYKLIHKFGLASVNDPSSEQIADLERAERIARQNALAESATLAGYWNGSISYGLGDARRSLAKLNAALAGARMLNHPELIDQIKASLGQSYQLACQYEIAEPLIAEALAALRQQQVKGPPTGLVYLLGCQAMLTADKGDFAGADAIFAEAFDRLGGADHVVASSLFTKKAATMCWRGDYPAALALSGRALDHSFRTRERFNNSISNAINAFAEWKVTGAATAIARLEDSCNWFLSQSSIHRASLSFGWLCEALSDLGADSGLRRQAARAVTLARAGDLLGLPMTARALARQAVRKGQARRAERYIALAYRAGARRMSAHELARTRFAHAVLLAPPDAAMLLAQARAAAGECGIADLAEQIDRHLNPGDASPTPR